MLSDERIRELLAPFEVALNSHQLGQLRTYLDLLLRWNQKINLTAIRGAETCITRNFGESFFLACYEDLRGRLLDVGSGAGFPGLALKIIFPGVEAVLLEPIAKKRAFLKEVIRACGFAKVEVRPERLHDFSLGAQPFDAVTARAVGGLETLIAGAAGLLRPGGKVHLWVGREQGLPTPEAEVKWIRRVELPLSERREIVTGVKRAKRSEAGRSLHFLENYPG